MKIKKHYRNPLLTPAGLTSAWFLFHELKIKPRTRFISKVQELEAQKQAEKDPLQNFNLFKNILHWSIIRDSSLYRPQPLKKSNGKKRILLIPRPELKRIQHRIDQVILKSQTRLPYAYGFSGGSVKQALEPIVESKQAVFTTDVIEAFPSTNGYAVYNVFRELGYGMNASYYLTCLTTWFHRYRTLERVQIGYEHWRYENNWHYTFGLPQGAPTSPRLFDLCFLPIDKKLKHFSEKIGGTYVRYADNLFMTAPQFWPAIKRNLYYPKSFSGTHPAHDEIRKEIDTVEGVVNAEKNEFGGVAFHSPVISAIHSIVGHGYPTEHVPFFTKTKRNWKLWSSKRRQISFNIHKNFLAQPEQVLHALGLNLIDGQLHNTRQFKMRFRMTIFNLQKALEQKDDFEEIIWPLYLKLKGMMQWAVRETLPEKLLTKYEELEIQVEGIRYSGPTGTRVKNINTY